MLERNVRNKDLQNNFYRQHTSEKVFSWNELMFNNIYKIPSIINKTVPCAVNYFLKKLTKLRVFLFYVLLGIFSTLE